MNYNFVTKAKFKSQFGSKLNKKVGKNYLTTLSATAKKAKKLFATKDQKVYYGHLELSVPIVQSLQLE